MMPARALRLGLALGLILAMAADGGAMAQLGGQGSGGFGGGGGRRGQQGANPNATPLPDHSGSGRTTDPEAHDAIDLFSRLCVSTQGSRERAIGIIGDGDSAIEKMEPPLLRGMENGQSGGIGWIIRMPLGEKILLEFPPDGSCIVRAPRVSAAELEAAFRNLLDQYSASGQFVIKREGEQTKAIEPPRRRGEEGDQPEAPPEKPNDNWRKANDKLKYHIVVYTMTLPDSGRKAQLVVGTTDAKTVSIQGVLSYEMAPAEATGQGRRSQP
jgi:hypothetical protein